MYGADGSVPTVAGTGFLTGIDVNNGKYLFGNAKGCGLGWAKTDGPHDITNMFCTACKPGYRPTNSVAGVQAAWPVVTSCELIAECNNAADKALWMNACYDCVHFYDIWNV